LLLYTKEGAEERLRLVGVCTVESQVPYQTIGIYHNMKAEMHCSPFVGAKDTHLRCCSCTHLDDSPTAREMEEKAGVVAYIRFVSCQCKEIRIGKTVLVVRH
jgi:hypothetical protein